MTVLQLIPRPPWQVEPLLPDLAPAIKAAYLSGLKDGFLAAVVAVALLYCLLKEIRK